ATEQRVQGFPTLIDLPSWSTLLMFTLSVSVLLYISSGKTVEDTFFFHEYFSNNVHYACSRRDGVPRAETIMDGFLETKWIPPPFF
ncbi:hypothetical protein HPP92_028137, partial [Vanilla planifolia]